MSDRTQLNLRLDGRKDLLETIKGIASAEGLSLNAWVIKTLEQAASITPATPSEGSIQNVSPLDIEPMLDTLLDNKLAAKLAAIKERLGKLKA